MGTDDEPAGMVWVGQELFTPQSWKIDGLKNQWYPLAINHALMVPSYFGRGLFLWMARKMWHNDLVCSHCKQSLLSRVHTYREVRVVIDVKDHDYLAGEYMTCNTDRCKWTYIF